MVLHQRKCCQTENTALSGIAVVKIGGKEMQLMI